MQCRSGGESQFALCKGGGAGRGRAGACWPCLRGVGLRKCAVTLTPSLGRLRGRPQGMQSARAAAERVVIFPPPSCLLCKRGSCWEAQMGEEAVSQGVVGMSRKEGTLFMFSFLK